MTLTQEDIAIIKLLKAGVPLTGEDKFKSAVNFMFGQVGLDYCNNKDIDSPDREVIIYPNTTIGKNFKHGHWVVIYQDSTIGDNCAVWDFTHIRENCRIGNNVSIGSHCKIEDCVIIGNNVRIHSGCFLPRHTVIEDDVWIGPNVTFTNDRYPNTGGKNREGVTVKQGARIGAGVTILPGVTIDEDALVGAGSVVTRDIWSNNVVVGNPAEFLRYI